MSKFKPGVRVVVIDENHELRKGVINASHEVVNVAIVKFDDGNVEKVDFKFLGLEPKEVKEEPEKVQEEPKRGPVIKPSITITPGEFMDIANRVIYKEVDNIPLSIAMSIIMNKVHFALFVDAGNND